MTRGHVRAVVIGAALALWATPADAYPHFQFSSDTETCRMCHFAPAGGGLLTGWGRDESADTLSRGGNGELLHGLWEAPDWLAVGGDFRGALLANDTGSADGAQLAGFPMQADLAARVAVGDAWSATVVGGLRGSARRADIRATSDRDPGGFATRLISREHYLQWEGESKWYARAGRFYAPFGLRLPDHTTYVRRYTGFNLFEETYGVSGGTVEGDAELHLSGFVSDPLRWAPRREAGGAALAEWRFGPKSVGASTRIGVGPTDTRIVGGTAGKWWLEGASVLLMAEVDAIWQRFGEAAGESRFQLVSYLGPVWFPTDGVSVSAAYELFDEDLAVAHVERHALSSWISFLPTAHFEILLLGRAQRIGPRERAFTGLLQLHYYL